MPILDPTDKNGDGVYVLNSESEHYLLSKTTSWNVRKKVEEYTGKYKAPSWAGVQIDQITDGVQIRDPKGKFLHGISLGSRDNQQTNSFPLWLSETRSGTQNCSLTALDYTSKKSYKVRQSQLNNQTPGRANSQANEDLIKSLKDCDFSLPHATTEDLIQDSNSSNQLNAYPNPFQDLITINCFSTKVGLGKITLLDLSGKKLIQQSFEVNNDWNRQVIQFGKDQLAGVYILQVDFPSGESKFQRMIKI